MRVQVVGVGGCVTDSLGLCVGGGVAGLSIGFRFRGLVWVSRGLCFGGSIFGSRVCFRFRSFD